MESNTGETASRTGRPPLTWDRRCTNSTQQTDLIIQTGRCLWASADNLVSSRRLETCVHRMPEELDALMRTLEPWQTCWEEIPSQHPAMTQSRFSWRGRSTTCSWGTGRGCEPAGLPACPWRWRPPPRGQAMPLVALNVLVFAVGPTRGRDTMPRAAFRGLAGITPSHQPTARGGAQGQGRWTATDWQRTLGRPRASRCAAGEPGDKRREARAAVPEWPRRVPVIPPPFALLPL